MKHYICTAVLLFFHILPLLSQNMFYVSPVGNDRNDGSLRHPVRTVSHALVLARSQRGETTIFLRQGAYRLKSPLALTSADGNEKKSLVIRSYPGEKATLLGGVKLNLKWEKYKDGIARACVEQPMDIDMLIVDGRIRPMARFPDFDSTAVRFNGTSADATSPERVKRWKNPKGGYLHAMHAHDWGDFHYRIAGKEETGKLMLEGGHQNNRKMGLSRENRMVENIFEELDAPGEWFYDKDESMLYYYPLPGEDVEGALFEVPWLKHLVEIQGSSEDPVCNISLEGISFTQTVRTFMEKYEPLLRSDWTVYRGGAIRIEGTANCHIRDCDLYNLGGNGVFFSRYNRRSSVEGCHFRQIGASAILFVGDPKAVRSPSFEYGQFVPFDKMDCGYGSLNDEYPEGCVVYDNLIHSIGLFEKQVTGVELSMCHGITVSHNSIYDVPRAGINISEGTWGGHVIEYNDIFDTVKETGDHGSFNSWGRDRFWHPNYGEMCRIVAGNPGLVLADALSTVVIRYNRMRCDRGWDIDLDDGSSNYHIYRNLLLNGGIKLREGLFRVVENNVLVNNTFHPHVWFKNSGDVFRNNIVMSAYQPVNLQQWGTEVDYNIFTSPLALDAARRSGTDSNSVYVPLEFVNPSCGDFRVKPEFVTVFRCGFQNFDMMNFGVVSSRLESLARRPKFPQPFVFDDVSESKLVNWQGWRIKNLETMGERSATGMDSERGVYIVVLYAYDSPVKDFFKPNDVILGVNGEAVDNIDDLLRLSMALDKAKSTEVTVFRNQKECVVHIPSHSFR